MAIWYVDPLKTTAAGTGTYADPFGIGNNNYLDAYVNNGDEIRILGKDITTLSSSSWTMKPFRINDGTTSINMSSTANGLGLKVVTGSVSTGYNYIVYCLELDMFCYLAYDSSLYTYYLTDASNTHELAYYLQLNNISLNTTLTFYAINTASYTYANNKHVCCFNSPKHYLTITDNWINATTRSTGVNKIMSLIPWGSLSQYYVYFCKNINNSTVDCSNTVFTGNYIYISSIDVLYISDTTNTTIKIKNVSAPEIAHSSSSYLMNVSNLKNTTIEIKYFRATYDTNDNYPLKIYMSGLGTNTTNSFIFEHYIAGRYIRVNSPFTSNINVTIKNLIVEQTEATGLFSPETAGYSLINLLNNGGGETISNSTVTNFYFGKIWVCGENYATSIKTVASKFYVFDPKFRQMLKMNNITLTLLENFDVVLVHKSVEKVLPYYSGDIALHCPELNLINGDYTLNFTSNLSSKTTFINNLNPTYINIMSRLDQDLSNNLVFKTSNGFPKIARYNCNLTNIEKTALNFVGNYSVFDYMELFLNNKYVKFAPINSISISYTDNSNVNVCSVYEDYFTYKTISPAISIQPYVGSKYNIASESNSTLKHILNVEKNKNYNLTFSLMGQNLKSNEVTISLVDNEKLIPVVLNGTFTSSWETINIANYISKYDQNLAIICDVKINNQKCKLTLSDIILTQIN